MTDIGRYPVPHSSIRELSWVQATEARASQAQWLVPAGVIPMLAICRKTGKSATLSIKLYFGRLPTSP